MRFFSLTSFVALAASAAMVVQSIPVSTLQARGLDVGANGHGHVKSSSVTGINPISLNVDQLTQCVSQIVDQGARTCDLTLLNGLTSTVLGLVDNTVGQLLICDGHLLDLGALTDLVNQATGILKGKGKTINVNAVLRVVTGLLQKLPTDKLLGSLTNGGLGKGLLGGGSSTGGSDDLLGGILGGTKLTLVQVKLIIAIKLQQLGVEPLVVHLTGNIEEEVCDLLEELTIDCEKLLPILVKQGGKLL
ncbi:hypothetical protein BDA99DRAFT_505878 [Phascolomyces articulosus]|uniref:Uncharacterized protein n=1 Tax=Phascolomyces articulosus TaxID=60185 RepID=A0AAD5K2G4_9FUNG|nr:hypothetical protein BDA99DRAFT_505878 [Phascolomyces articulosus]